MLCKSGAQSRFQELQGDFWNIQTEIKILDPFQILSHDDKWPKNASEHDVKTGVFGGIKMTKMCFSSPSTNI